MKEKAFEFKKINGKDEFHYRPPAWCSAICRNAYNEICIEGCSAFRDAKHFEPKEGMNIEDMPRFPLNEFLHTMTPEERKVCIGIYMARMVDNAQGVRHEPPSPPVRRPNYDGSRSRPLPEDLKGEDVLPGVPEANPAHPPGTECESPEVRPSEVAGE